MDSLLYIHYQEKCSHLAQRHSILISQDLDRILLWWSGPQEESVLRERSLFRAGGAEQVGKLLALKICPPPLGTRRLQFCPPARILRTKILPVPHLRPQPMSTGSAHLYHTTHPSSAGEVQHCFPTELPLTSAPFLWSAILHLWEVQKEWTMFGVQL